ncbi:S26 family signal peptidase [Longimycelium tulufanense]|uniref:S26 family signal peptidase n=1 Tax=Longimycelium tulufanense TaxID=907463 RepID=UPI0016635923|nr:S26 family signal peptidase [Longimycelium tulufanense]
MRSEVGEPEEEFSATEPEARRLSLAARVLLAVLVLGFGFTVAGIGLLVTKFDVYTVPGNAMADTIRPGDRAVVLRAGEATIRRGDVVLFDAPR